MNVNWDTTAILTQSVRTHLDLILVNAMMDLLEMVSYVKVRSFSHFASADYFTNRACYHGGYTIGLLVVGNSQSILSIIFVL